ncbi:MAG TPA: ATP-dependent DNA helicase RecG, partial [Mycobacteriales bacterium]|nr:ATP-dependent DNA helicase RecG [Mycobacteriales bacterium]
HHYPRRYAERAKFTDIMSLEVGQHVTLVARVASIHSRKMRQRPGHITEALITDDVAGLRVAFFDRAGFREKALPVGTVALFSGQISTYQKKLQLAHPSYEKIDGEDTAVEIFGDGLIPVYSTTAHLPTWRITKALKVVLEMTDLVADPLPETLRAKYGLVDLGTALRDIHRPPTRACVARAQERLKWDEALTLQTTLAQRRAASGRRPPVARPLRDDGLLAAFEQQLPFTLTDGQREVGATISRELAGEHPMHRLLQGEVGSGKTIVAVLAMLQVIDGGGQAALLAPTEVLAAQHARSLRTMLGPLGRAGELDSAEQATRVTLLTGSLPAAARRTALQEAAGGEAGIVVGTHALIQDGVDFAQLGLVVVDEQHRFGVEQRDALRAKADAPPHVLVMTATPIPRTVAMTVFGDLDTSALRELPKGRIPIVSSVVPAAEKPTWLERAWARVREEVAAGHQAYVVCPRIGDDEPDEDSADEPPEDGKTERRPPLAVLEVEPTLREGPLAGLRIAVLHGRMPADEKDLVMRRFAAGEIDVLVATTVVEVGVDVPNATVMVIMDADRFGISQLHQLRGRVGRGSAAGLCLLVSEFPAATPARQRLDAVAATLDGFELAYIDLQARREGDVLGAAQSGTNTGLKLLSLLEDEQIIAEARAEASAIVAADPDLVEHPALAVAVSAMVDAEQAAFLAKT